MITCSEGEIMQCVFVMSFGLLNLRQALLMIQELGPDCKVLRKTLHNFVISFIL